MTYRYRVATIFLAGFFIDCINIFMSSIALPDMAIQLKVNESSIAWIANSYILGLTLIMPLSTWISNHWGARATIMTSMIVFSAGALLSGLSDEFGWLVVFRFIQGVGGGLLIPIGQALTFGLFGKDERANISTLIMAVALIAPAISPSLGGVIVDHYSWRWVFLSNIPFSLATAALAFCWIKSDETQVQAQHPDVIGLIMVSLALASLLLGMSLYASASSVLLPLGLVVLGVVFGMLYIRHYRHKTSPILDLSVLSNPRMQFSVLVYYAVPGIFTGINLLNIFFLQQVLSWGAAETGMLMILYAGGAFCAMTLCGRLYNRVGAASLFTFGLICHASGIALLALVNVQSGQSLLVVAYLLMGIGGGIGANTAQTTSMIDFEGERLARASTIWNLNRQMAFSVGVALFTLLFNLLQRHTTATGAYHNAFLIGAVLGVLPLLRILSLKKSSKEPLCDQQKS